MKNSQPEVHASQIELMFASPHALQARPALFPVILFSRDFVKNQITTFIYRLPWFLEAVLKC